MKRFLNFCGHSFWIVQIFFYVLIAVPLAKGIPGGLILPFAAAAFAFVWFAKWRCYRKSGLSKVRFLFDMLIMLAGLAVLYCAALGLFGSRYQDNDFLEICCYLTSCPAYMSIMNIKMQAYKQDKT